MMFVKSLSDFSITITLYMETVRKSTTFHYILLILRLEYLELFALRLFPFIISPSFSIALG